MGVCILHQLFFLPVHRTEAMPELDARPKMAQCASATFSPGHSAAEALCSGSKCPHTPKRELGSEQKHVERIAGRWRKRQRPSSAPLTEPHRAFKHNLQLLVGNPCQHCGSTNPSLVHSIPPSNWRNPHCSRREGRGCRQERNRRSAQGSPFHAPCSTTPSCPQTIQPPSWRSHQHNCKGRQEELASWVLLALALALASALGLAEGIRRDGSCSTTTSCLPATCPVCPLRS